MRCSSILGLTRRCNCPAQLSRRQPSAYSFGMEAVPAAGASTSRQLSNKALREPARWVIGGWVTASELAAWWGAGTATLVLVWDVVKWRRSGPQLQISANPHMKTIAALPGALPNARYVLVKVVNNGDRRTTLTHFCGAHFPRRLRLPREKPDLQFVVPTNKFFGAELPHELEPGSYWQGGILENQLEEKPTGRWYVGVVHSAAKHQLRCRVRFRGDRQRGRQGV